jgi:hypothetical protein
LKLDASQYVTVGKYVIMMIAPVTKHKNVIANVKHCVKSHSKVAQDYEKSETTHFTEGL